MIGNFEKKSAVYNLSDNILNYSNLSAIDSLFLCSTSTSFTTTEFITETKWQEKLTANTIYQIKNILEVQNQSEAIKLYESKFNFRYKVAPGKYRFLLLVNIDLEYFVRLEKLEYQQLGCYFSDINNNLYGVLSSGNVIPFNLEFVGIQKLSLGTSEMCLAGLFIDFYDPSEFDNSYIANPTWSTDGLCPVYWNEEQSQIYYKNNCVEGIGTGVTYTVSANTYSSTASLDAANQLALDDITANGQAYANANGTCEINLILLQTDFSAWHIDANGEDVPDGFDYDGAQYGYQPTKWDLQNASNACKIIIKAASNLPQFGIKTQQSLLNGGSYKASFDIIDNHECGLLIGGWTKIRLNGNTGEATVGHHEITWTEAISLPHVFSIWAERNTSHDANDSYITIDNLILEKV